MIFIYAVYRVASRYVMDSMLNNEIVQIIKNIWGIS